MFLPGIGTGCLAPDAAASWRAGGGLGSTPHSAGLAEAILTNALEGTISKIRWLRSVIRDRDSAGMNGRSVRGRLLGPRVGVAAEHQ